MSNKPLAILTIGYVDILIDQAKATKVMALLSGALTARNGGYGRRRECVYTTGQVEIQIRSVPDSAHIIPESGGDDGTEDDIEIAAVARLKPKPLLLKDRGTTP